MKNTLYVLQKNCCFDKNLSRKNFDNIPVSQCEAGNKPLSSNVVNPLLPFLMLSRTGFDILKFRRKANGYTLKDYP